MKRNVLPFGIIAIVGIFAAIIVFYIGVAQQEDIELAEENDGEEVTDEDGEDDEDGEVADDPEAIFANSCATCHGDDLSGDMGPDLTSIGSDHSQEDIEEIIAEGQGAMPPGTAPPEEAEVVAEWLSEMK